MTIASPKGLTGVISVARSRSSIVVMVGGLAAFLFVACFLLISYPINSSFQGYFQERSLFKRSSFVPLRENHTEVVVSRRESLNGNEYIIIKEPLSGFEEERGLLSGTELSSNAKEEVDMNEGSAKSFAGREKIEMIDGSVSSNGTLVVETDKILSSGFKNDSEKAGPKIHDKEIATPDAKMVVHEVLRGSTSGTESSSDGKKKDGIIDGSVSQNSSEVMEIDKNLSSGFNNDSQKFSLEIHNEEPAPLDAVTIVPSPPTELEINNGEAESRNCDLYQGKWIYDPAGPLYTNNTCPFITQMQNCQGNGRPDKDYENYRWKPDQCELPRFSPRKFLELMRGKTMAFIGDSVARNQFESLLCILWQEETPKNRGNRRMQRWYFKSTSTMIIRIWSSWLVHQNAEPFQFAPKGVTKVFLDTPDETFMELLPTFDVVVLSSGHWFAKQSAYILNNTIVGGQLWWPKDAGKMRINNVEAFGLSVETAMSAIANHPNFTGLAIVRSYSPDHYEGGAWNTGGSCTGKIMPVSEVVRNGFTDVMHEKQTTGFQRAVEKSGNGRSKMRLMDITEAFGYRPDGHPGPYRSLDPNKITKRGPNGEPPPQDCLHWCMPGPVDTWNEIMLEVMRREIVRA